MATIADMKLGYCEGSGLRRNTSPGQGDRREVTCPVCGRTMVRAGPTGYLPAKGWPEATVPRHKVAA